MDIITEHPVIEGILPTWQGAIGDIYLGYRGHVYRVFNFSLRLKDCDAVEQEKLAIALCFHDLGLWSAQTIAYLEPSIAEARKHLAATGKVGWSEEISQMIDLHHKIRNCRYVPFPLVEVMRRADLVDFTSGWIRCGIARAEVKRVQAALPDHGFHPFLMKGAKDWFLKHPLSMPPFMRW